MDQTTANVQLRLSTAKHLDLVPDSCSAVRRCNSGCGLHRRVDGWNSNIIVEVL